jgi:hypothetical protein
MLRGLMVTLEEKVFPVEGRQVLPKVEIQLLRDAVISDDL